MYEIIKSKETIVNAGSPVQEAGALYVVPPWNTGKCGWQVLPAHIVYHEGLPEAGEEEIYEAFQMFVPAHSAEVICTIGSEQELEKLLFG